MNKKLPWLLIALLLLALLIGGMLLHQKEDEPLPTRVYMWRESSEEVFKPSFILFEDGTFNMTFSGYSSYFGHGTYQLNEDTLVLNTDDGYYTYTFKVQENGYIFDAANSSANTHYAKLPDGALFW